MVALDCIQSLSLIVASIFIFLTACRCSDTRISVGLSHNVSHPGDNVTLTCRVQGAQKETAVVWEKLPVTGAENGIEIIGSDDQLSEDYRKFVKYDIFVIELPDVVLSILTINNVGWEDSGLIGCSISVEGATYREATLFQVFKQPSDISCSCEPCPLDSVVEAIEGESIRVQCIVRGVQPLPHASAHLGQATLSGGHLALTNWTANVHCGHSSHCPVHFDYDVQFTLTTRPIGYLDDGLELTVAVSLGHSGWPATVKRMLVNVRYAPKFTCSDTFDVDLHSRNLVIVCRVLSNPALAEKPVVWWRHHRHGNTTIHVGQTINGFELREKDRGEPVSLEGVDGGSERAVASTLELVIEGAMALQDTLTEFHFYAQNDIGSTTKIVRLRRKTKTTMSSRSRGHHTKTKPLPQLHPLNRATRWTVHPPIFTLLSITTSFFIVICLV